MKGPTVSDVDHAGPPSPSRLFSHSRTSPGRRHVSRATRGLRAMRPLDWVTIGLALLAIGFVVSGLLPGPDVAETSARVWPILLFLVGVIVLAELAATAMFFDVVATRIAILGRGRYPVLFALTVAFATATTVLFNLDTTAVLLTPVMIAMAKRAGLAPLPVAMTTVWLANTASLLLPVSNLTNLLAAGRVGMPVWSFAARMALPQIAVVATTAVCLWVFYWRPNVGRYRVPEPVVAAHRGLFVTAASACGLFVAGVLAGLPLAGVAILSAAILAIAFAVVDRDRLLPTLIPWRLLVFVSALFLVVATVSDHGLDTVLRILIGANPDGGGIWRAAGVGAALSNGINNLPAYLAGESVIPAGHTNQLLALLLGVNLGPLVLPWASLATLLWHQRCAAAGVRVPWLRFILTGLVTATVGLAAATAVLWLTTT